MPSKSLDHNYIKITSNKIEADMDLQISVHVLFSQHNRITKPQDCYLFFLISEVFQIFDHVAIYLTPWHIINGRTLIFAGGMKG